MQKKIKVLFLSVGFVPEVTPSDKKFVLDIINNLSKKLDIVIWSLNDKPSTKNKIIRINKKFRYNYYSDNRILHKNTGKLYKPHKDHSMIRSGLEINLSLIWYLYTNIRYIIKTHKPDLIHLTDSFGPAASILKKLFKNLPVTVNKPTMRLNGSFFYNLWVKKSLKVSDSIFTYTEPASKKISRLGIDNKKIKILPWGINTKYKKPKNKNVSLIRKRYNCYKSEPLIVILPRSNGKKLLDYVKFIEQISYFVNAKFIFAIRPTRYLKEFSKFNSKKVKVVSGPKDFYNLLSAADLAICEYDNNKSTSLLPLACMEAMLRNTPILTNNVPGINELVLDKFNGLIFKDKKDLKKILINIKANRIKILKNNSKKIIENKFNINLICETYYKHWNHIINSYEI